MCGASWQQNYEESVPTINPTADRLVRRPYASVTNAFHCPCKHERGRKTRLKWHPPSEANSMRERYGCDDSTNNDRKRTPNPVGAALQVLGSLFWLHPPKLI